MVPAALRNRPSGAAESPKCWLAARLAGEAVIDVSQPTLDCTPCRRTSPASDASFAVALRRRFEVGLLEASCGFGGTFGARDRSRRAHSYVSNVAARVR